MARVAVSSIVLRYDSEPNNPQSSGSTAQTLGQQELLKDFLRIKDFTICVPILA